MFVIAQAQVEGLQRAEPIGGRLRRRRRADDGQGIDKQAQLLLDPRQRCRTPGHRGTEGHAGLAGVTLQQQGPGTLQHGVKGDFTCAGKFTEGAGEVGVQHHGVIGHAGAVGGHTQRIGQQSWRLKRCQGRFPERFAAGLLLQPAEVIAELPCRRRDGMAGVVSDHFGKQLGVTPAIHQDVVTGEYQVPPVAGAAHQHQAKQRRRVEGKALVALGFGQCIQIGARVFDHLQLQIDMALDQLMGAVQAQPMKAAAQDVMAVQGGLPGTPERQQVQAFDIQAQLVDIGLGLGFVQGVEQHALLHRRQRVEIGNLRPRHRQPVQLRLAQARQGEIRRRDLPRRCGTAQLDHGLEFGGIVVGQTLDGRLVEHLAAKAPTQRQLATVHLPFHCQPIGQRRLGVLGLAAALWRRDE